MYERSRFNSMGSRFVDQILLAMTVLLCTQGFTSVSNAAAQPLSAQVSELLRRQLEVWKTPPPEAAPAAPPDLMGPHPPVEAGNTPETAPVAPPDFVGPPAPANLTEAPPANLTEAPADN